MGNCLDRCGNRKLENDGHRCTMKADESMSFLPPLRRRASYFRRFRRAFKKSTLISEYNPQSADYFRSKAEILRTRKEHVLSNSCIIHPFSLFRAYYEMWMTVVWILVIFLMPADAAFDLLDPSDQHLLHKKKTHHISSYDPLGLTLRMLCIIDIVMTFFTGYPIKKSRKVIMNPIKIAKHYVLSLYFITDILASTPFEFFVAEHNTMSMINVLGFLRIIRLPTLYFYLSRSIDVFGISSLAVQVVKNLLVNYLVFHWFACFQYMIPQIRFYSFGEIVAESWVERTDVPELSFISKYFVCLYRAAGGLLCITFEEIQVEVWEEKLLAIVTFIFGKVYVFYVTVLILNFLLRQRSLEIKYFETISQVQAYMSQKQLPMSMQIRLLQFYDYKYNKKFFKERGITSLLSDKLKGEINLNVCSKLVQNVALLGQLPQQTLEQVVTNLKAEIYLANDIIIKAGSVGDCMYFLASGTVGVWTPSGKEVCHLQDGAYFGEISLVFKDKRRTANIVAVEICEVYKLERKAFKNCFKTNTKLYRMLEDVANERMEITQMFEDVHAKTFMELNH